MNAQRESVTRHHQRRVAQRPAVGEELLERDVEVFTRGFVLPGKHTALKDIRIASAAADDGTFFFKQIAVFTARLGHAEQVAQVNKVALRSLLFV